MDAALAWLIERYGLARGHTCDVALLPPPGAAEAVSPIEARGAIPETELRLFLPSTPPGDIALPRLPIALTAALDNANVAPPSALADKSGDCRAAASALGPGDAGGGIEVPALPDGPDCPPALP